MSEENNDTICDMRSCRAEATTNVFAVQDNFLPALLQVCNDHTEQFRVGQRFHMNNNTIQTGLTGRMRGHYVVSSLGGVDG